MMQGELLNATETLLLQVEKTQGPWERARGLLGKDPPACNAGLLFDRCRSIHTFFMQYPIDVFFIDRHWEIVAIYDHLKPFRVVGSRHAFYTLEMSAGESERLQIFIGEKLVWRPLQQHS